VELTITQHRVLVVIAMRLNQDTYSPSSRDICDVLGLASTNAVAIHLKALKKKGMIAWEDRLSRTVRPTDEGWEYLLGREVANQRVDLTRSIAGRLRASTWP